MRTKIIASLAAGGLLVGAGLVASIVSSPHPASAQDEADSAQDEADSARDEVGGPRGGSVLLNEALDELTADGVITAEQAAAVLSAVEAKAEARRAERQAHREKIGELLDDGALTRDELDELPDGHPFGDERFDEAWDDGELSEEELREMRHHPRRGGFKRGGPIWRSP